MRLEQPDRPWRRTGAPQRWFWLLLLGVVSGCRSTGPPPTLSGDALLLAPTHDYLDTRLALVEAEELDQARRLWAIRSLLPQPPPDLSRQEYHWWSQLGAAAERLARGRRDGQAYYRLARVLHDVRWHREALVAARRALELAPEHDSARQLEATLANMEQLRVEVDSLASTVRRLTAIGEAEFRQIPRQAASLAGTYGFTNSSLLRRGLFFGRRPPARDGEPWGAELAVIVEHRGAVTVSRPDGALNVRRIVLDDDRFRADRDELRPVWRTEPSVIWQRSELAVYHHRATHRRAGMLLFRALEARAGAPPATLAALGDGIQLQLSAPGPPRPGRGPAGMLRPGRGTRSEAALENRTPPNGGTEATAEGAGDRPPALDAARLADALRLQAVAPLFDAARTAGGDRLTRQRIFLRELMLRRMDLVEQRAVRIHLDQSREEMKLGPQRLQERLILELLRLGPLPRWVLADLFAAADQPEARDAASIASRAILRFLRRTAEIDTADGWLRLTPRELRDAAETIAADRFGAD